MTQFCFSLIGSNQALLIDVDTQSLPCLGEEMRRARFVEGDLITDTGELIRVLLPTCRIQFVTEPA